MAEDENISTPSPGRAVLMGILIGMCLGVLDFVVMVKVHDITGKGTEVRPGWELLGGVLMAVFGGGAGCFYGLFLADLKNIAKISGFVLLAHTLLLALVVYIVLDLIPVFGADSRWDGLEILKYPIVFMGAVLIARSLNRRPG